MKRFLLAFGVIAAASALPASDAPPPTTEGTAAAKTADAPPPKTDAAPSGRHRLGGGFKGQSVATEREPAGTAPKPAPAPKKTGHALVIDNRMVRGAAGGTPSSAKTAAAPAPAPAAPPPPVEPPKILDLQGHDEAYWRAKASATRGAVQTAEAALAAAEAEEKREETDFYSWDDGQYRDNVIKPAWDHAKEATAKARAALEAARKELDGLEDEARRAGAFPGWIR